MLWEQMHLAARNVYWLLGTSDQKRHFEKRLIKEKRERMSNWEESISWTRDAVLERESAPELVCKVLESERASEKGGTEGHRMLSHQC
jgi:hypothetical protein